MTDIDQENAKRMAGRHAADLVRDNTVVGLGTGSTTAFAIEAIGSRIREEGLSVQGVATSFQAELLARKHGVPLTSLFEAGRLAMAIDGADEVDADLNLVKGRGGAHTREKIVAAQADQFVVLVDDSKLVGFLGERMPVPVEVLPMAAPVVQRSLEKMGAKVTLREGGGKDGPVVTDQGLWILDARFTRIEDPGMLATSIKLLPGVLDHGLFIGMADVVIVGRAGELEILSRGH
jgi:ribose 5-phosphate isomerase A